MKLNTIEFGNSDGKIEAGFPNFESLFYNHKKIYETLLKPYVFIISGRRGCGKTTLVEYFLQKKTSEGCLCQKDSYESFRLNQLIEIKNSSGNKDEYYTIWNWTILIEIAKLIYKQKNLLVPTRELKILLDFMDNNNFHIELGGNKTIAMIAENNIHGTLKLEIEGETGNIFKKFFGKIKGKIHASLDKDKKTTVNLEGRNYLNYLNSLENIIFSIFQQNKEREFYIVYDELDSFFTTSIEYKKIILDLVKCIEHLNGNFRKKSFNCKILISLRSDILNLINYPSLNKLLSDSTLELKWNDDDNNLSPLVYLIANKIKASALTNNNISLPSTPKEIFYSLFKDKVLRIAGKKHQIHLHILNKTLRRPRDIVYFFDCLKRSFGESEEITDKMLYAVEKEYSDYFLKDIRSELCGHFEDKQIDECLELIKIINKRKFTFNELPALITQAELSLDEKMLKNLFKKLFEYGAIGNIIDTHEKNKYGDSIFRYNWYYLNSSCSFNHNLPIIFHFGLYKILNLI